MLFESLESRRLLAGVTLLAHGYNGNITGWVEAAADDIAERAGRDEASIYTMTVTASNGALSVSGFGPDSGQKDYRDTSNGEIVVKLDWSSVSGGSYTTQAVANVVSSYFLTSHGTVPPLAELPIHLIGHSRGASLITAMSQQLGRAGVWVDQVTSLDPHPVDGVNDLFGLSFGDQKMTTFDNVLFADDYWRTDGNANNTDFDGESVKGTYQGNLNGNVQQNFFVSAHGAVPAYYIGTIDTGTSNGGDHPVLGSWYDGDNPDRDETGYIFSRLGGATRPSSGLSGRVGGGADRDEAGQSGSQWASAFNLSSLDRSVAAGQTLRTKFLVEDRDSNARVTIYIDENKNPYDGVGTLTSKSLSAAELTGGRIDAPTAGLRAGTYYLAAAVTDAAGHTRWTYSPTTINITAPRFAVVDNGKLTITGTDGNDKIRLYQSGSNYVATLNGAAQTIPTSSVNQAIEIYAGLGKDSVDASGTQTRIYVNAGPGQDVVVGGDGNDTLSGGAQSNTLIGGLGDDALNGSAGYDFMVGNGGYDRFYGNGGFDTMSGGSNADRFYGGDDADSILGGTGNDKIYAGGGNDTLIGGANADILAGGEGINTGDNDPLDLRSDIDVLI